MQPEKEIVEFWLSRQGFFTIADINAGSRVIDLVAIRQDKLPAKVAHVEIACYVSGPGSLKGADLLKKFSLPSVVRKVREVIREYVGSDVVYERFLVTTAPSVHLDGVNVIDFSEVLFDVVSALDTQFYSNNVKRTLQLVRFALLSNPSYAARLIGGEEVFRVLTHAAREQFVKRILERGAARGIFSKKENEPLLVELLKGSTLKQPERLASALEGVLTRRTAAKFLDTLLKQKAVKTAIKKEFKNATLQQFV